MNSPPSVRVRSESDPLSTGVLGFSAGFFFRAGAGVACVLFVSAVFSGIMSVFSTPIKRQRITVPKLDVTLGFKHAMQ